MASRASKRLGISQGFVMWCGRGDSAGSILRVTIEYALLLFNQWFSLRTALPVLLNIA